MACNHHVDERYYDGAVKATFGEKTESPSQTQCLAFKKWFAANKESIPSILEYDAESPPISVDNPFLIQCREDLAELQSELMKDRHLHLPRGDYVHLWELVQVMVLS